MNSDEFCTVECGECGDSVPMSKWGDHLDMHEQLAKETKFSEDDSMEYQGLSDNIIRMFVEKIKVRPALWDYSVPLQKRTRAARNKLWKEIYHELNGAIPLQDMPKKWKNLRDQWRKKTKTYKEAGSNADDKNPWKHYELMKFLMKKSSKISGSSEQTINGNDLPWKHSSSPHNDSVPSTSSGFQSPSPSTSSTESHKRKRSTSALSMESDGEVLSHKKNEKPTDETEQLLLGILKQPLPAPISSVTPAMVTVSSVLEKLPTRIRMQAEIEFLNRAYHLYYEHGPNDN